MANPLAVRIAYVGLEHWQRGAGALAAEFMDGVLRLKENECTEREFRLTQPGGITDKRWIEMIYRTCLSATFHGPSPDPPTILNEFVPYSRISTLGCRRKHGRLDGFAGLATDPIWQILQPPFDWGCICSVDEAETRDISSTKRARIPGIERLQPGKLQALTSWMDKSPISAFASFYPEWPPYGMRL